MTLGKCYIIATGINEFIVKDDQNRELRYYWRDPDDNYEFAAHIPFSRSTLSIKTFTSKEEAKAAVEKMRHKEAELEKFIADNPPEEI